MPKREKRKPSSTFSWKPLGLLTLGFFLAVNTQYFWNRDLGIYSMFTFVIMLLYFFSLILLFIRQVLLILHENFQDRKRLTLSVVMALLLITAFFWPNGLINFRQFGPELVLRAQREGAANCMTTLHLRANNSFWEGTACFGESEITGSYTRSGDTVYFHNVDLGRNAQEYYEFAVIREDSHIPQYSGEIVRYRSQQDTTGLALWIVACDEELLEQMGY
ncbi:MAG TPA: hypothetical protein DCE41_13380 [Cytophagales bacterium]|nr:hypothetical protein [Cytophagales bacterium]HAA22441.1 hypothetical protein [Cytophagales bacterium]HAP59757.1 hypothetical protein [Cytophagales bacterium]